MAQDQQWCRIKSHSDRTCHFGTSCHISARRSHGKLGSYKSAREAKYWHVMTLKKVVLGAGLDSEPVQSGKTKMGFLLDGPNTSTYRTAERNGVIYHVVSYQTWYFLSPTTPKQAPPSPPTPRWAAVQCSHCHFWNPAKNIIFHFQTANIKEDRNNLGEMWQHGRKDTILSDPEEHVFTCAVTEKCLELGRKWQLHKVTFSSRRVKRTSLCCFDVASHDILIFPFKKLKLFKPSLRYPFMELWKTV